jgi:hypothetical protein
MATEEKELHKALSELDRRRELAKQSEEQDTQSLLRLRAAKEALLSQLARDRIRHQAQQTLQQEEALLTDYLIGGHAPLAAGDLRMEQAGGLTHTALYFQDSLIAVRVTDNPIAPVFLVREIQDLEGPIRTVCTGLAAQCKLFMKALAHAPTQALIQFL